MLFGGILKAEGNPDMVSEKKTILDEDARRCVDWVGGVLCLVDMASKGIMQIYT